MEKTTVDIDAVPRDLAKVLNEHNVDTAMGMPDHVLAEYMFANLSVLRALFLDLHEHQKSGE